MILKLFTAPGMSLNPESEKECGSRKEDIELPIICQEIHTIEFFTSAIIQITFYVFGGGSNWRNDSLANADKLPVGLYMIKQAYWLNKSDIDSYLDSSLQIKY